MFGPSSPPPACPSLPVYYVRPQVHDYHLFLLPQLLRRRRPGPTATIGFFLHTPFCAADVFALLPPRREVLIGILGSDVVCFHTFDFARAFLRSCQKVLGGHCVATPSSVQLVMPLKRRGSSGGSGGGGGGDAGTSAAAPVAAAAAAAAATTTTTLVRASPIGIEPDVFLELATNPATAALLDTYCRKYGSVLAAATALPPPGGEPKPAGPSPAAAAMPAAALPAALAAPPSAAPVVPAALPMAAPTAPPTRIIVAVDRLDPIKGVVHRLLAFQALLRRHPEWVGSVVMIQVAVPSRADVAAYAALTARVNGLVGEINSQFATLSYTPLQHLYRSVSQHELAALYALADVCLVTSLRDGCE